jgi:protease PrsW
VIREELAGEVGRSLGPTEYRDIVGDRLLRSRRIDPRRPQASAALVNAQHELAFRKRRVRDGGNDPDADPVTAAWREDIGRLRAAV